MKRKTLLILIISVVVLIIIAVIGKRTGLLGKTYKQKVSVEKPEKRKIVEAIMANGKIQPQTEVKISPDVSGEIVELHIIEGDQVKEGDLLLKIRPDIYQSALERMRASLNASKANLSNSKARLSQIKAQFLQAELTFKRQKKLWEQGVISQADYEQALSSYQVAKAEVRAAEQSVQSSVYAVKSSAASLKEANENLTKTSIYAPMDGTVSMLNVEKGERVVGTMQMPGTEMLRIADLEKMEVVVDVNENDIVRVSHGDTAIIEIDAYLEHKFRGVVTEIANSANVLGETSDQVTNFEVKILILRDSYQHLLREHKFPFRPGMSATADIQTETRYNVISVPIQAVTTRKDSTNQGGEKNGKKSNRKKHSDRKNNKASDKDEEKEEEIEVVFVLSNNRVVQQKVTTGIQDDNYIEIKDGLTLDEEVVVAPYSALAKKLKNNMEVEKVSKEELFKSKE